MDALQGSQHDDLALRDQFSVEAEVSSHADHERVVSRKLFHSDGQLRTLFEIPRGVTLESQWLPLDQEVALEVCEDISLGLASIHAQGMVHGALRPDAVNVYLDEGRAHAVLLDVGFCVPPASKRLEEIESDVSVARQRLPPELANGAALGIETDVYEFGALCFELFTGRPWRPDQPTAMPPEIPASVQSVLVRCLAERAEDRLTSMESVAKQFSVARALAASAPGESPMPIVDTAASESAPEILPASSSRIAHESGSAPPTQAELGFGREDGWFCDDNADPDAHRRAEWVKPEPVAESGFGLAIPAEVLGALAIALIPIAVVVALVFLG